MTNHSALIKFAIEYIRSKDGCAWKNQTAGIYDKKRLVYRANITHRGVADVIGVLPGGRHIEVECKTEKDKLRPDQIAHRDWIQRRGAFYVEMRKPEDLMRRLATLP